MERRRSPVFAWQGSLCTLSVLLGVVLALIGPQPTSAGGAGERIPNDVQRTLRLMMPAMARASWDAMVADHRIVPVAHKSVWLRHDTASDGSWTVVPVRILRASVATGYGLEEWLRHPQSASGGTVEPLSTDYYGDMYVSLTVNRDTRYSGYVWLVASYVQVPSTAGVFQGLFDTYNGTEDMLATAWAGGLALVRDYASGAYYRPTSVNPGPLDIHRADVVPNAGVAYMFHEWARTPCGPQGLYSCQLSWAQSWQNIREQRFVNQVSNAVVKYVHTAAASISPEITVGTTGGSLSIGVTPATAPKWTYSLYEYFLH